MNRTCRMRTHMGQSPLLPSDAWSRSSFRVVVCACPWLAFCSWLCYHAYIQVDWLDFNHPYWMLGQHVQCPPSWSPGAQKHFHYLHVIFFKVGICGLSSLCTSVLFFWPVSENLHFVALFTICLPLGSPCCPEGSCSLMDMPSLGSRRPLGFWHR